MVWTTTTLSSLEEIFMDLLKLTKQTETWHLLLQWLYLTLRALRTETISWILQPYNICFAHKPTTVLRHLPTHVKERTNPTTDREQFARSNARTARLPTLVRQADWLRLTKHKQATRKDDANNHIIFQTPFEIYETTNGRNFPVSASNHFLTPTEGRTPLKKTILGAWVYPQGPGT